MKGLRSIAMLTIGLAALSSALAEGAGTPATISILPGTWNCTTHGSTGTSTGTVTFTEVTPNIAQYRYTVTSGSGAGHKGGGEWLYDSKKGEYVALGGGTAGWGVSRGPAAADAMTVTLTDTYPSDPANGTTTYRFTQSTIASTSDWKKSGKPMHDQQTCTKV
jgi:hypothetical protein